MTRISISAQKLGMIIGILVFIGGIGATVWAMSSAFGEKANRSRLRTLEQKHSEDVHQLELGIWEMRTEQRILIDYIAPEIAKKLNPIPPPISK